LNSVIFYRERLASRVLGLIGEPPTTEAGYVERLRAFGVTVAYVDRAILTAPVLRNRVALIPDIRPDARGRLLRWLAHELAEAVLAWPGTSEYAGPGWSGDRHRVADLVERHLIESVA